MKKIYIAGPDVFEANAVEIGKRAVALCEKYGFLGLYPLDNVVNFSQPKKKIAQDIFEANVAMIQEADIIVANLNPFRGKEPDSGTVWECGYGFGLGKKVYGYMREPKEYIESFEEHEKFVRKKDSQEFYVDSRERLIEDFENPLNLMIACSVEQIVQGSFEDVLKVLKNNV